MLLRELQSDKIEAEFAFYRRSTGCNLFMSTGDVQAAYRKRLARFSVQVLDQVEVAQPQRSHHCQGMTKSLAMKLEKATDSLSDFEEWSVAYIAGWLEMKCPDLDSNEDARVSTKV